ncbi:GH36-type glycosyl hydrolase domain-containing protein [Paenibacillus koleovorans]|uniref:GH36-type glycosyl hydrolase domain-containing protein n=1 Tax=Paenibacillus koleovorans TaxID=121608 RepID=UPI001FE2D308|nr:glucoamylase family protein [Paenibacillus koleovorans]
MSSYKERLQKPAHKLALEHDPHGRRVSSQAVWQRLEGDIEELRAFMKELHEERSACEQPAEEWLLDHSEFLEAELLEIADETSRLRTKRLPTVDKIGTLRVSSISEAYLAHTDGLLEEDSLTAFFNAYQEVAVLTTAEAWSVPLFMKMEMIRRLAALTKPIKERRTICELVDRVLDGLPSAELTPERLKLALEQANVELPLSGALIVHLVRHLREHAADSAHVGEWLVCKMDNAPESLDAVLSYEYRLQAEYQVSVGNVIGSLRKLSRWVWSDLFEAISAVDQTLREEAAGDYPKLDGGSRQTLRHRVERLARRMNVTEKLVASQAVKLANEQHEAALLEEHVGGGELLPRQVYTAYYLLDAQGLRQLQQALRQCGKAGALPEAGLRLRASGVYLQLLAWIAAAALAGLAWWVGASFAASPPWFGWLSMVLLLAWPASDIAVTAVHWLIERTIPPTRLLRYDLSKGVPVEASTMVVIPVIWSRVEDARHTADRLELHHLANRDSNIHFAILSDFRDADAERLPEDDTLLHAARIEIERLNETYTGYTFHHFHRHRKWNASERVWMGWERKRGKLEEFARLMRGDRRTSFSTIVGDPSVLSRIRYVLTLDADTRLPLESAHRMIGAMHLPYNRPRLNEEATKVKEGYGVLQPRIGMTYESAQKSRLTSLWAHETGLDPYAFAVSDPYQDAIGQGIFTGKGIFDVDAFHQVLGNRFPENRVLSHDLLEGGLLRAGLLSDIELIDDHPPTFLAHQKRLHRWTRGDWQLLPWLRSSARNCQGEFVATELGAVTCWQIIDNMRRSLLLPALMAIMLLAGPLLPGSPARWYGVVLLTLLLPMLRQLLTLSAIVHHPIGLLRTLGHAALAFLTLPYQAALQLDAVIRTLYRLLISRRRLLEWVNQAEVERLSSRKGAPPIAGGTWGAVLIVLMAVLAFISDSLIVQAIGLVSALLWSLTPFVIRWLDQSPTVSVEVFSSEESEELLRLAEDIWSFYEDYVTARDNWLPPDNVQLEPDRGIAHRTSPTNIGMYITCAVAARDFGFIDTPGLVERLERSIDTLERMEKWEGHLYNWYDTEALTPLQPMYVSTVDSGNLVASLMTAKEGLLEWCRADRDRKVEHVNPSVDGGPARSPRAGQAEVAFGDELGTPPPSDMMARGNRLAARIEALVQATDFRPLYDPKTNLFSLGYHVHQRARDGVLYDLMASEARQASFVAIALGQVSVSHWNALGRTLTKVGGRPALLSWSATMFEYLMPWLLMKTYRHSIWDSTYRAVVERQIEYARQLGVPFGISESGYFAFDYQMNYQYQAFGVPGLGFKRGLEQELVLAPYATVMALPFAPKEGMQSLRELERLGGRGRYGFYEALDFTPRRMPADRKHVVIQSFMAHHQGMSLLTLSNLLSPHRMIDRFHRNKSVRAAELLLQERTPRRPRWVKHPAMYRSPVRTEKAAQETGPIRELASPHTPLPEVCLLTNGRFTTMVTASGSGRSSWDGLSISRWREEPVQDPWGSWLYIRDLQSDRIWSPSYRPCGTESPEQRIVFEPDKATFSRVYEQVETTMEIAVSPECDAELRRLTLKNNSGATRVLEITSFVELAMSSPIADDAHPAFSKLFIRTAVDPDTGCLVAGRRKREAKDRAFWCAHLLVAEGHAPVPAEYETDRGAFIGRGYRLDEPHLIRSALKGKTGSVADPAFVMRRRVQLGPGDEVRLYAVTSAAETREDAVGFASRLVSEQAAERTFQLAWTRSRVELRNLHLSQADAIVFQRLASQVLYTPPIRTERGRRIAANTKSQSGLWAYGISGDRPIVLVQIDNRSQMPFITKLLTGHEYLRRLGLPFDLIILSQSADGYQQNLQEALGRAVEHGVDRFGTGVVGIHVLSESRLSVEDRTLLLAVSRVTLRAGGPSLAGQLRPAAARTRESGEGERTALAGQVVLAEQAVGAGQAGQAVQARQGAQAGLAGQTGQTAQVGLAGQTGQTAQAGRAGQAGQTAQAGLAGQAGHSSQPQGGQPAAAPIRSRPLLEAKDVRFFNGWGGFTPDGKEYKLQLQGGRHLPAPWINVLANPSFGTLVSELGTGYTFARNSRECKLTPWSNDPVLDPPGEIAFLRDEESGEWWTLAPAAGESAAEPYLVTHGLGYTAFEHSRSGIQHTMHLFVPLDDPVKVIRVRLVNDSARARRLSVTYYAEWVIGVQRQMNAPFIVSDWDDSADILTAQNRYQENFCEATAFLGVFHLGPQAAAVTENELSWTADQLEFIGRNRSADHPAAMSGGPLSGQTGVHHAGCGAIRRGLTLAPGEEAEVLVLLGCTDSAAEAAALARRYRDAAVCEAAWQATSAYWERTLGQIAVETPSLETDILLNGWLLYQSLACRMWARSAFYQAGGAYGFRDQLQDSLALLHTAPDFTRQQIIRHASHQYEEGDVQHWWHEETQRGIRTLFSDDLLWLPYGTSRYLEHTGDESVLDERAAYITSEPLREGEHERYEPTVLSSQSGTVYEHCLRAIDKALSRIGEHDLPLIGIGDWNDGMSLVGDKGRGESVWLGWFLCDVLQRFEPLCAARGDDDRAARYALARERFAQAIHEHGWDGQWYRRAFTDAGTWLGSLFNDECRIDAIAQSWSVISGAAPADRALTAMQSFDRELVDRELSVVKLLTPPFDRTEPSPGYIQGYPPGIRENGAQYTHGVIWSIVAWAKLGRGDKAFELFQMLNPINHTRTEHEVRQYYGEPYVMAADVYTSEPHCGHAGWTWYTGASGWMYQSGIEWILGLQRRGDRLYLNPSIPPEWPGFRATYRFGDTKYKLVFSRDGSGGWNSGGGTISTLLAGDAPSRDSSVPDPPASEPLIAGPDTCIELVDDGIEREIAVKL